MIRLPLRPGFAHSQKEPFLQVLSRTREFSVIVRLRNSAQMLGRNAMPLRLQSTVWRKR